MLSPDAWQALAMISAVSGAVSLCCALNGWRTPKSILDLLQSDKRAEFRSAHREEDHDRHSA